MLIIASCAVIVVAVAVILRDTRQRPPQPALAANGQSAPLANVPPQATGRVTVASPTSPVDLELPDFGNVARRATHRGARRVSRHYETVRQAAARSCSTKSVDGLSRQIIGLARCIAPDAFMRLPKRRNLSLAGHIFPYLQRKAGERLLRALEARSDVRMTIHSALRTVAQQYLVWRWASRNACGVQLAARPGTSNHEIGLALDIGDPARWRTALEKQGFRWLGRKDKVHFDYRGPATTHRATDVLAFQKLWNKNHPDDKIKETGLYDAATEKRLEQAPPDGFDSQPRCSSDP